MRPSPGMIVGRVGKPAPKLLKKKIRANMDLTLHTRVEVVDLYKDEVKEVYFSSLREYKNLLAVGTFSESDAPEQRPMPEIEIVTDEPLNPNLVNTKEVGTGIRGTALDPSEFFD
jgi:hypothetical protein